MHEFNIGKAESQLKHLREMAALFKDGTLTPTGKAKSIVWREHFTAPSDSDPPADQEVIEAKTDDLTATLVVPGTTKEFVRPFTDASHLNFACPLPGHSTTGQVDTVYLP